MISFFILLAVIGSSITAFEYFFKPTAKDCGCGPGYGANFSSINAENESHILQDGDDDVLLLGGKERNRALTCKLYFACHLKLHKYF